MQRGYLTVAWGCFSSFAGTNHAGMENLVRSLTVLNLERLLSHGEISGSNKVDGVTFLTLWWLLLIGSFNTVFNLSRTLSLKS